MTDAIAADRTKPALPFLATGPLLLGLGAVVLAAEPTLWLIRTWRDPVYASHGYAVALAVAALIAWSVTSGPARSIQAAGSSDRTRRTALALLLATALVRLASQTLDIRLAGALALVIDLYAFALLLKLHHRPRPVAPVWLAVLFAFSLPLERVAQRTIGFALQQLSADGACLLLDTLAGPVSCTGVRILLDGTDVLVDLPCSGAQGLLLMLTLFAALAAVTRPRPGRAAVGLGIVLIAALVANSLRIAGLALGIAHQDALGGLSVMAWPWHDAIGLIALALGVAPLALWARTVPATGGGSRTDEALQSTADEPDRSPAYGRPRRDRRLAALLFLIAAVVIVSLPARPVDVARRSDPPALPGWIDGWHARPVPLSDREKAYFTRFGGGASRAGYGANALMLVRTTAPLRHLHAPDECLTGAGHEVRFLTTLHAGLSDAGGGPATLPVAVYHSTAPDGRAYRILVTFVSDRGEIATSVAEAVWRWLRTPDAAWTQVQRIVPAETPPEALFRWEVAVRTALDLPGAAPEARPSGRPS